MSTHNIRFHAEIKIFREESLSGAVVVVLFRIVEGIFLFRNTKNNYLDTPEELLRRSIMLIMG